MPRATISDDIVHKELKTCPGGYVKLRRMTYGDWLRRNDMAMALEIDQKSKKGDVSMQGADVANFEFAKCVVEHNLEDADGRLLNFNRGQDVQRLDPKIGNEIGSYIDELHNFDAEETGLGNESEPS
jgi:hypothetical protein